MQALLATPTRPAQFFFDKRVKGGLGVVADDVVAGVMAGTVVLIAQAVIPSL